MLAQRNSRKQGDVGLGSAIAYYTAKGYTVCVPLTDSQKYDLVVELDGILQRVQVKTATMERTPGVWTFNLRTCGGNQSCSTIQVFDPTASDVLFVLCGNEDRYVIPTDLIDAKHTLSVGKKYLEYKV